MAAKKTAKRKPMRRTRKPAVLKVKAGETLVVYHVKAKPCGAKKPRKRARKKPAKPRKRKPAKKKKKSAGARHSDGFAGWA